MTPGISGLNDNSNQIEARVISSAGGGREQRFRCNPGTTVREVATSLNLATNDNVARVNSQNVSWDHAIQADDLITFAPLKSGGASPTL